MPQIEDFLTEALYIVNRAVAKNSINGAGPPALSRKRMPQKYRIINVLISGPEVRQVIHSLYGSLKA